MKTSQAWAVVAQSAKAKNPGAWLFIGPPGVGKSSAGADMFRTLVRRHGGVFIGWEAGDTEIVTDPPEGPSWRADFSDPRFPRVQAGKPAFVYRHVFVPGTTAMDYRGVIIPSAGPAGPVATWTRPGILQGVPDKAGVTVLVLDEIVKSPELGPLLASLLHGGRTGEHELPGCPLVVGLGNDVGHRAGAKAPTMDLVNRMGLFTIEPDPDGDIRWARRRKMPDWAIVFAAGSGGMAIYSGVVPEKSVPFPSPRSWWAAVREVSAQRPADEWPDGNDPLTRAIFASRVGPEVAGLVCDWLATRVALPTAREILGAPETATVPERPDMALAAGEIAARALATGGEGLGTAAERCKQVSTYLARLPAVAVTYAIVSLRARVAEDGPEGRELAACIVRSPLFPLWREYA